MSEGVGDRLARFGSLASAQIGSFAEAQESLAQLGTATDSGYWSSLGLPDYWACQMSSVSVSFEDQAAWWFSVASYILMCRHLLHVFNRLFLMILGPQYACPAVCNVFPVDMVATRRSLLQARLASHMVYPVG